MKRLGVLLIGQVRNLDIAIDFFKKEFDLGHDIKVDFFCHTWDRVVNFSPWDNLKPTDERFKDAKLINQDETRQLFDSFSGIVKYKIDNYDGLLEYYENYYYPYPKNDPEFNKPGWQVFDNSSTIPFNDWSYYSSIVGQFYSTEQAMKLLVQYENENNLNYDAIVRWRSDLASNFDARSQKLKIEKWIDMPLRTKNTIFVNNVSLWDKKLTAADLFWHGDAPSMKTATLNMGIDFTRHLRKKILQNKMVLNEEILVDHIRSLGLNLKRDSIGIIPIRPGATMDMTYNELLSLANKHEQEKRRKAGNLGT